MVKYHVVLSCVDYETLRTTGVILAVIMFVSGILIALSEYRLAFKYPFNTEAYQVCIGNFTFLTNLSFLKQVKNSQNV